VLILTVFAFSMLAWWLMLERGCRDTPPPRGVSFFDVRHERISKKARTRGDIDHLGRSRRERALSTRR